MIIRRYKYKLAILTATSIAGNHIVARLRPPICFSIIEEQTNI